jgi:SagB-type dehydrogenase family enzyme
MNNRNEFLQANRWKEWKDSKTDQKRNIPAPSIQKQYSDSDTLVDLVPVENFNCGNMPLIETIKQRQSRRKFTGEPISFEELSFLIWSCQGIRKIEEQKGVTRAYRTTPSGGCRHPFETYLLINYVSQLKPGLYRYAPLTHQIVELSVDQSLKEKIHNASFKQYIRKSAVVFIWTVIPYRTEWRYSFLSPKLIAQDSGHLCQNLYLACESLKMGTCAIGYYDQEKMDKILGVDGENEFTIYLAPVGKIKDTD